jgi:hypothetical protein
VTIPAAGRHCGVSVPWEGGVTNGVSREAEGCFPAGLFMKLIEQEELVNSSCRIVTFM